MSRTPGGAGGRSWARPSEVSVLLVENDEFTREVVAAALREAGCAVTASVATAREAIATVHEGSFDCAVVELGLGAGPSGIELAHALRTVDSRIAIVILTSFTDPRLYSEHERELPSRTVYAVKNDVRTIGHLRELIDMACGVGDRREHVSRGRVDLTNAQVELLRLVAVGCTNAEIARRREVSERSVEAALTRLIRRLQIEPESGENARVLLVRAFVALAGGVSAR